MTELNVAMIGWLSRTPVAPFAGRVAITTGGVSVVNVHTKGLAKEVPATFCTPVVSVAVKVVPGARGAVGAKVAVAPVQVTVPNTGPEEVVTVKVVPITVEHFTAAPALSGSCAGS